MSNRLKDLRYQAPKELRSELSALVVAPSKRKSAGTWIAASLSAAAIICAAFLANFNGKANPEELLKQEIVSVHVRSLMADHLFDVASSDTHTVKPWFTGKLDFSPRVLDIAEQGFPLVGGRLEYISGRSAAALVYKRNQHVINLLIWPSNVDDEKPALAHAQGFNIFKWTHDGMFFAAISDLNAKSLEEFVLRVSAK